MSDEKNPPIMRSSLDLGLCSDVTLRDLFAGFALCGLLAHSVDIGDTTHEAMDHACGDAYDMADRMLEARNAN